MCGYADLRIGSADITAKSAIRSDHSADPIRSDGSTDRIISAKFGSVADNYRRYADIIRSMCSPILDHLKGLNRHISTSVEAVSDDVKLRGNAYAGVVEQVSLLNKLGAEVNGNMVKEISGENKASTNGWFHFRLMRSLMRLEDGVMEMLKWVG